MTKWQFRILVLINLAGFLWLTLAMYDITTQTAQRFNAVESTLIRVPRMADITMQLERICRHHEQ